ncbi:MAG: AMP-binding protein [Polyangiaceae bacterium]
MARPSPSNSKFATLGHDLREVPVRIRAAVKVGLRSGLARNLTAAGVRELVRIVASGSGTPDRIYRLHAANSPNKTALVFRDRSWTYAELDGRIERIASGLAARGFARGRGVVLMTRNRPEFIEINAAASRVGVPAVSVSWRSTAKELAYLVEHCGAEGIVFEDTFAEVVAEARKDLPRVSDDRTFAIGDVPSWARPYESLVADRVDYTPPANAAEDAAVVIYTSGTTGKPKGAVRKFPKQAITGALQFIGETPMRSDDVHLVACPLYHSTAFGFMAFACLLGGTIVLMDDFKPEIFLAELARHRVTQTAVVPTMLHRTLALGPEVLRKYDTRSLRAIFACGAPLPGPLAIETMDAFGDVLYNCYGATEIGLVTVATPEELRAAPGTIGHPITGNVIRLLDEKGDGVPDGEVGELFAKNRLLVAGYHQDEKATNESMSEGFFSVGDLARRDSAGRYFIEGRKRDMIISGGVNVYPAEVEGVLEGHPDVSEVAVVGAPDADLGERVRAFVVKRPGSTLDDAVLKTWARERLSGAKVPRDYVFMDALPRNPTGKVLKKDLRLAGTN